MIGPEVANRLRVFLGRCVKDLALKPANGKQWLPFKSYCLYQADNWENPKPHSIAVFYLVLTPKEYSQVFQTYYCRRAVGFDVPRLAEELVAMGFVLSGADQYPRKELKKTDDQAFFDSLYDVLVRTVDELDESLHRE